MGATIRLYAAVVLDTLIKSVTPNLRLWVSISGLATTAAAPTTRMLSEIFA